MKSNVVLLLLAIIHCVFFTIKANGQVINPILPGFYPDPSICRVGDAYYIVNSSFSYYPGVPIFHSTDLIHWEQIGHVLDRPSQLNLDGLGISEGIFAPAIEYKDGVFYMITTLVGKGGNFYVTAKNPAGPWSDPVWLPKIDGIDPSFFFDENDKTYIVNNGPAPDNKPLYNGHRAIWLQEYNLETKEIISEQKVVINGGTDLAKKPIWIEGPHIYKNKGYYYLMAAEGGTGTDHSEVIFRSKSIWGPYESFGGNPILTQRDLPADRQNPITCTGHADLVRTQQGDWVAVFLGCQPYSGDYYNTGRQTFFQNVNWSGEWPIILEKGEVVPEVVKSPLKSTTQAKTFTEKSANWHDDFDQIKLKPEWNFIRTPREKWFELKNKKLILSARNANINERVNPSFIGRRLQHANAEMTTAMMLESGKELEAGLVAFQNEKYHYNLLVKQINGKYFLSVSSAQVEFQNIQLNNYNGQNPIYLRMKVQEDVITCEYSLDQHIWEQIGDKLDAKQLSTNIAGGFVGAYLGLYAFAEKTAMATFDWVHYQELKRGK